MYLVPIVKGVVKLRCTVAVVLSVTKTFENFMKHLKSLFAKRVMHQFKKKW